MTSPIKPTSAKDADAVALPDPRENGILASLPSADLEELLPHLQYVPLPLGWVMSEAGDHVDYLHFPTSGIVSHIYDLEDGGSSEVALVGNEGIVGISVFMGGESMPSSTKVQSEGAAYRLNRKEVKHAFAEGGKLQNVLLLFTQALIAQTSQTAVCNQHHPIEQQLSRWILMSADRLQSEDVVVTQELLSTLLGVRRESITGAAGKLQKDGLIALSRGHIEVVDRKKLESRVCECYETVRDEYKRLLPGTSRS